MLSALLQSMRPRQATKNLLVFGALLFIPGAIYEPGAWLRSVLALVIFTLAASAGYIFNDIRDIDYDRGHPRKKFRPIASGKISPGTGIGFGIFLLLLAAAGGLYLDLSQFEIPEAADPLHGLPYAFLLTIAGYLVLTLLYSLFFKDKPILDVIILSIGFVLRAVAGAVALRVIISPWLLLCTGLLALFLALGKRRQELVRLGIMHGLENSHKHGRAALAGYTVPLVDQMLLIAASVNIMSYSLYTFSATGHPDNRLMLTIPFVIYGIFRYHYLVHNFDSGESPEEILLNDKPMIFCLIFWILSVGILFMLP